MRKGRIAIDSIFVIVVAITFIYGFRTTIGANIENTDPLVMGVFPRRHATITTELFNPMAKYLSQEIGRRVFVESAPDMATFWKRVRAKHYDIVHFNQYHYIRTHKEQGYEVILVNEERGKSTEAASIVVRSDSNIKSVMDLKGKRVLFGGGKLSMQSYIYARYLLQQGGLDEGDYEPRFASNSPTAIVAAYHKLWGASAAGSGDAGLNMTAVSRQIDPKKMRYLAVGNQYAHLPWAVRGELPSKLKQNIKQAMLKLNVVTEGKKILKTAKLTGLVAAIDSDFDPHRKIVKSVLGEVY